MEDVLAQPREDFGFAFENSVEKIATTAKSPAAVTLVATLRSERRK